MQPPTSSSTWNAVRPHAHDAEQTTPAGVKCKNLARPNGALVSKVHHCTSIGKADEAGQRSSASVQMQMQVQVCRCMRIASAIEHLFELSGCTPRVRVSLRGGADSRR